MDFPKAHDNYFQERSGVLKVATKLNEMGLIFRETYNADLGIDGQIEYVSSENFATGKIVAAQIKSGRSYFIDKGTYWAFYPAKKHRDYWLNFPLQVILFLHNPTDDTVYYTNVSHYLNIPTTKSDKYLPVPKINILNASSKEKIFKAFGELDKPLAPLADVLEIMISRKSKNGSFPISYFDLFINGLTNLCRQLYFSVSIAYDIAEYKLELAESEFGVGLGYSEHEFLHAYVKFLIEQNLAKVDYSDYLIDWEERLLQPAFLAPITTRGRELFEVIRVSEDKLLDKLNFFVPLISERGMSMNYLPSDYERMRKALAFQNAFINFKT